MVVVVVVLGTVVVSGLSLAVVVVVVEIVVVGGASVNIRRLAYLLGSVVASLSGTEPLKILGIHKFGL